MAAYWWWTWSIGLPSVDYSTAGFTVSNNTNVVTNNTTSLFTPALGSASPSEEFHLRVQGTSTIVTPVFSSLDQGWLIFRWGNINGGSLSPSGRIIEFMSGVSTVVADLRVSENGVTPHLDLYINNTLKGRSVHAVNPGRHYTIAIDFDFSQSPPQAGMVMNGVREIAQIGGSGSSFTFDRIRISSGGTGSDQTFFGDFVIFDDLADLDETSSQDVWVTFMDPNSATDGDNSWTPSSGTDLTAVNDSNSSTYTETSTSPDVITYGFESCNTRQANWNPTLIYGAAFITLASASGSETGTTLEIEDLLATYTISTSTTLTSTATFFGNWLPLDGNSIPWTQTNLETIILNYRVT